MACCCSGRNCRMSCTTWQLSDQDGCISAEQICLFRYTSPAATSSMPHVVETRLTRNAKGGAAGADTTYTACNVQLDQLAGNTGVPVQS